MTARERFTRSQIILLRYLIKHGASIRAITVAQWQRVVALPLWHRGLVEIWWKQNPGESPSGPFLGLSIVGARLAYEFSNPAPRGSGAEHDQ